MGKGQLPQNNEAQLETKKCLKYEQFAERSGKKICSFKASCKDSFKYAVNSNVPLGSSNDV